MRFCSAQRIFMLHSKLLIQYPQMGGRIPILNMTPPHENLRYKKRLCDSPKTCSRWKAGTHYVFLLSIQVSWLTYSWLCPPDGFIVAERKEGSLRRTKIPRCSKRMARFPFLSHLKRKWFPEQRFLTYSVFLKIGKSVAELCEIQSLLSLFFKRIFFHWAWYTHKMCKSPICILFNALNMKKILLLPPAGGCN